MDNPDPAALAQTVVWGALALGLVFGAVAARTNFCTMGAVSDAVNIGDWTRMRMWLFAIAVAVLGTAGLQLAGLVDTGKSIYTASSLAWLSHLVGGLLFGFGMVIASGCGAKTLVRIGTGNLKSVIVVMVMAITAYMTLRGLFGVFRVAALDPVAVKLATPQDLPSMLAASTGATRATMLVVVALALSLLLAGWSLASREFRRADPLLGSLVVGLLVVAGWYLSGHVGHLAEDPQTLEERFYATNSGRMESFSFVSPAAYLLELLMLWSDKSRVMTFGIAGSLGVVAGSFLHAIATRGFRLESFRDAEDLLNHIAGGALMGFGGVLALGCTVGQGITGLSTLALGSFISFGAVVCGALLAFRYQVWRIEQMD